MNAFKNAKWIAADTNRRFSLNFEGINASWCVDDEDKEQFPAPVFKRVFELHEKVHHAVLSVCGLGYGVYFLNEKRVTEDVLTTQPTKFDERVLYQEYDVSDLLREGPNIFIAVLGNGLYNDTGRTWGLDRATWRHYPKMLMCLSGSYENGEEFQIVSDTQFFVTDSPIRYNHVRNGEIYDARLEKEGLFTSIEFDDTWKRAAICPGPGGVLEKDEGPSIGVIREIQPVKIRPGVYDVGENISGWACISVSGNAGHQVELIYGEQLTEDGHIEATNINKFNDIGYGHKDCYILSGKGVETWHPEFVYHGFQYIEVINEPEEFHLTVQVVHSRLEIVGDFSCSDPMLNRIHEAARRSTLANCVGVVTDCPQREQLGWTGDAHLSAEQSLMNYDMNEFYLRWMKEFKIAQRPNGQLPAVIPTSTFGYNWGSGPTWDSALILIPYYVYRYTGDRKLIVELWDNMCRLLSYMDSREDDGILEFGLGDWCAPGNSRGDAPLGVLATAYYYSDYCIMAEMAQVLGKDATIFLQKAKEIKKAFRRKFLYDGIRIGNDSQTTTAVAIYHGLYEAEEIPSAAKHLADLIEANDYLTTCGIMGMKAVFTALSEYGYAKVIYKMITNPNRPSYANWMNRGITTLCESWSAISSRNHHMFSEVEHWFYRYVAGLRIEYGNIFIKPCLIDEVETVCVKHKDIEFSYDKTHFTLVTPKVAKVEIGGKEYLLEQGTHKIQYR